MRQRALTFLLLMVVPLAATGQEPPVFEAETEVVHLDVFVTRDGLPVRGLAADDFEVRDSGQVRPVEVVSHEDSPTSALLVFDVSESVAGARLRQLKGAGEAFLNGLRPQDRAGLLLFNHRSSLVVPPGSEPAAVVPALAATQAEGGTALYDALLLAFAITDPSHGRPMLVVFSDGADRLSWSTAAHVVDLARQTEVVLVAVDASEAPGVRIDRERVGPPSGLGESRLAVHSEHATPGSPVLRMLADETGGHVWAAGGGDLQKAFLAALADVQSRYVLRYEPPTPRRSGWHPVEVHLRGHRPARLRVRKGYFVP